MHNRGRELEKYLDLQADARELLLGEDTRLTIVNDLSIARMAHEPVCIARRVEAPGSGIGVAANSIFTNKEQIMDDLLRQLSSVLSFLARADSNPHLVGRVLDGGTKRRR